MNKLIHDVADFEHLLAGADHVDVKQFEGEMGMRAFLAGMFNYSPAWLKTLYGIRWGFVRLLGMKQEGIPVGEAVRPADISMTPGEQAGFFRVEAAQEGHYWIAGAKERHLDAYLGLLVEPLSETHNRFHFVTIVHYQHWTGPVYFNVIRPFHHLVVQQMGRAALRTAETLAVAA